MRVSKGPSDRVNFNIAVVGEERSGKSTFTKALISGYEDESLDFHIRVLPNKDVTKSKLVAAHNQWLNTCATPLPEQAHLESDYRVHCLFYLFPAHRALAEHKEQLRQLIAWAPVIPVISKADALTDDERSVQVAAVQAILTELLGDQATACNTVFDLQASQEAPSTTAHPPQIFYTVCTDCASGMRQYPWGSVDSHDERVSDLHLLQHLIFECGNINKLRATTQEITIRRYEQREEEHAQRTAAQHTATLQRAKHRCEFDVVSHLVKIIWLILMFVMIYRNYSSPAAVVETRSGPVTMTPAQQHHHPVPCKTEHRGDTSSAGDCAPYATHHRPSMQLAQQWFNTSGVFHKESHVTPPERKWRALPEDPNLKHNGETGESEGEGPTPAEVPLVPPLTETHQRVASFCADECARMQDSTPTCVEDCKRTRTTCPSNNIVSFDYREITGLR